MFSQTSEYALRAMICLAESDERMTGPQIAARSQVPAGYLAKILSALARAGLVDSRRGIGGGFTLAGPPEALSILDVINAVDPIRRITACPLNLPEHATRLCPLHRRLDDAMRHVEEALGGSSLADLLAEAADEHFPAAPATAGPSS